MPPLSEHGRDNAASDGLSVERLNGQVYTPDALARRITDALTWPDGPVGDLLDPACGDGRFLVAAVRKAHAAGRPDAVTRVVGWDLDPAAVAAAEARLRSVCADLDLPGPGQPGGPRVLLRDALDPTEDRFACIVGNPPYVESKRMPDALKARVRRRCPVAATGGFDLYGAFVELGARLLVDGGELAFLLPNRVLVTRATRALRLFLLDRGDLRVVDLSTEDVFGRAAAVYPVLLRHRRGSDADYAVSHGFTEADTLPTNLLRERLDGLLPVLPADRRLARLVRRVLVDEALPPLVERYQVRWTVSFHRSGLRDAYVFEEQPDSPHARRFLGGGRFQGNRELEPFRITWGGAWIDHDEERAKADRNGLPSIALFDAPKVVLTQNARRCRAALDTSGLVLKDTFPLLRSRTDDLDELAWITLVLNSHVFHVVYEALFGGTRKGGRYLAFLGSYLHAMPCPEVPDGAAGLHAALVEEPEDTTLRARAEAMVRDAYGVTEEEAAGLDALDG